MKEIKAIWKRDFLGYFRSPIGWVLLAIFTLISSLIFSSDILNNGRSVIASELSFMQSLFFVLIPILTMKSFSEERKNGTEILLFTSPSSTAQIVLGKYLAAFSLFLVMTATTLIHVLLTIMLGGRVDAVLFGTYVAFILSGAIYIAIGVFVSSLTENQIIAAIVSVVIFVSFQLLSMIASMLGTMVTGAIQSLDRFNWVSAQTEQAIGSAVTSGINWINPATRLSSFSMGIFQVTPLVFLISFTALFIYLTAQVLEKRRWSQS